MNYTDTYRQDPADMLAAEFVTVYAEHGQGRIHAATCTQRRGGGVRTATTPAAMRNGLAEIAPCCKDREPRLFTLYRRTGQGR